MVKLLDHRDALARQSIDEDQLPQRSISIEGFCQDLATEAAEVAFRTPSWAAANPDVSGDIEIRVIKPDWWSLVEQPRLRPLPKLWKPP